MRAAAFLVVGLAATRAHASDWGQVFAADSDTVVFLAADGALWKAPFHLAARETLWSPSNADRLVRVRPSPDGRHVAWLTRASDQDTTRLWIDDGARPCVRFSSLQPSKLERLRFENAVPSTEDPDVRGARFLTAGPRTRRLSANPMLWTPDGGGALFGYDDGLAVVRPDGEPAREVSKALAISVHPLEPAPLVLVLALVLRAARPDETWYLAYPGPERWKMFPASGLTASSPWTASPTTVWWGDGRALRAVRVDDPAPTLETVAEAPVVWMEYDPTRAALAFASGSHIVRRAEGVGAPRTVLDAGAPIRGVLAPRAGRMRAVWAGDALTFWDPATDRSWRVALDGRTPLLLVDHDSSGVWVALQSQARGHAPELSRFDRAAGTLTPIETPAVRDGHVAESPGGGAVLVYAPGTRAPETLHVFTLATGVWSEVRNPGITGWEPMGGR